MAIVIRMDGSERKLRDVRELRALAHPVRMRLSQALYERGTATATELAEMIGESPANCSWHLRQLAKYGFVEEAGGGKGRNRPWRPAPHAGLSWGDSEESGEVAAASDALSARYVEHEFAGLRDWQAWWRTDPPEWQDAANWVQNIDWLTVEELKELNEALTEIIGRHRERRDPAARPPGARRIRIFAWAVPATPYADD